MNDRASYTELHEILSGLDRIPVRDYRIYVDQFEEGRWRVSQNFFDDSRYQLRYAKSLYEIGQHQKFIYESEMAMIYLLNHGDWEREMRGYYLELLFKKAISHVRLTEYEVASNCCKQLKELGFERRKIKFLRRFILESEARNWLSYFDNERFYFFLLASLSSVLVYLIFSKLL